MLPNETRMHLEKTTFAKKVSLIERVTELFADLAGFFFVFFTSFAGKYCQKHTVTQVFDLCESVQICRFFFRSLQICADSKKKDLLKNTIKPHSNVKRIMKMFETREKSHLCRDETIFCSNQYRIFFLENFE